MKRSLICDAVKWNFREILLLLIAVFVQIQNGQKVALICAVLYSICTMISVKRTANRLPIVLLLWFLSVIMMIVTTRKFSSETWVEIIWLLTGIGVTTCAYVNVKEINHRIEIVVFPTVIICALNILYYYKLVDLSKIFIPAYAGTRLQGGFDGPNEIGAFVVIVLTYMWMQHIYNKKVKLILLYTAIVLYAIVLTWSRGAFICAGLVIGFVLFVRIMEAPLRRKAIMLITTVIACILLAIAIKDYILPKMNYIRIRAGGRDEIFQFVLNSFTESPICGLGLDPFSYFGINRVPHSTYFFVIMAGGLVGLITLVSLYYYFLRSALKRRMMPEFFSLISYYILEQGFNNIIRGRVLFLFLIIIIFIYAPENHIGIKEYGERNGNRKALL